MDIRRRVDLNLKKYRKAAGLSQETVKPLQMVADSTLDCSTRGKIVADGFAGSGTTLLAAAKMGRIGVGIEIDPHYADLIVRRMEEATGETAIHADSFESFDAIAKSTGDLCMSEDGKDYEVGYRKPPKHTQFRKRQSGNPRSPTH